MKRIAQRVTASFSAGFHRHLCVVVAGVHRPECYHHQNLSLGIFGHLYSNSLIILVAKRFVIKSVSFKSEAFLWGTVLENVHTIVALENTSLIVFVHSCLVLI